MEVHAHRTRQTHFCTSVLASLSTYGTVLRCFVLAHTRLTYRDTTAKQLGPQHPTGTDCHIVSKEECMERSKGVINWSVGILP